MFERDMRCVLMRGSALAVVACCFTISSEAIAQQGAYAFNIPSESLAKALHDYSSVSGQQIIFSQADVAGKTAPALKGSYSPEEALRLLLAGTDLVADRSSSGGIMVNSKNVRAASDDGAALLPAESVTVTGSRVITDVANSPTPIISVTTDQLLTTTPTGILEGLNKLPQFLGGDSAATVAAASSRNSAGTNLSVRYLGGGGTIVATNTLVLMDGHRLTPTNANGTVNAEAIPFGLVKRVDIVTGGASAVYGSDAVAGVVNFVLDKKFEGFKYDFNAGISDYGDGMQYQGLLVGGADLFGGRGHLEGSLRYKHRDQVRASARPRTSNGQEWTLIGNGTAAKPYDYVQFGRIGNQSFGGVVSACSGCAANNMQFIQNGIVGPFNPGTPTTTPGTSDGGDGTFYNPTYLAGSHQLQAFGRFSYDLSDTATFYAQASMTEVWNYQYFINKNVGGTFYTTNAYLTPAAQALLANPSGKFALNEALAEPRGNTPATYKVVGLGDAPSVMVGADGLAWDRFSWDVYYTHGQSRQKVGTPDNINLQKLNAAQDAVPNVSGAPVCYVSTTSNANLYPGCVPINPFGPTSVTQEQLRYITEATSYVITNIVDDLGGSISGDVFDLPAGPVKVALSTEARWNSYGVVNSLPSNATVNCTGLRLCSSGGPLYSQGVAANVNASSNVYEAALEANVPVLKDVPLVQSFNVDLAGRFTNYSTSGSVETWKIGVDYHVNDDIRFRGTASVDIRAPSLNDLFAPQTSSIGFFQDFLTGVSGNTTFISGGNPKLVPVVAHTWTGGIVLTPGFVPGLTASLDYYRVTIANGLVNYNSGPTFQALCLASAPSYGSPVCSLWNRPIAPSQPGYTSAANFPISVRSSATLNAGAIKTEEWDAEINYHFDLGDVLNDVPGSMNFRALVAYQPYDFSQSLGSPITLWPYPKGRMSLFAGYAVGAWSFDVQNTWRSDYSEANAAGQVFGAGAARAGSFNSTDITITRTFTVDENPMSVYLNVQNIGNVQSPLYNVANPPGYFYAQNFFFGGTIGRYFTIGVRGNF